MKCSVVMTTYNYAQYLDGAVESVLTQSLPHGQFELIVVDDGSTDDTASRIHRFGEELRYVRKPNGGQASALNVGIGLATGDVVSLLDGDDYWLPGKLSEIERVFAGDEGIGIVSHGALIERDGLLEEAPFSLPIGDVSGAALALEAHFPPTSMLSFRRAVLEKIGPIPEEFTICPDYYLFNIVPLYARAAAVPQPLAVWRIHGGNWSEKTGARALELRLRLGRSIIDHLAAHAARAGTTVPSHYERYKHNENTTVLEGRLARLRGDRSAAFPLFARYLGYVRVKYLRRGQLRLGLKRAVSTALTLFLPGLATRLRGWRARRVAPAGSG
jgi:glycosyltransferase involved in cell wall biosynthesis